MDQRINRNCLYAASAAREVRRAIAIVLASQVLAVAPTNPASAHPHVFVSHRMSVDADDTGRITGLRHSWTFDDIYSAFAVQGLARNWAGSVRAEALQTLARDLTGRLAQVGYYTRVETQGAPMALKPAHDSEASWTGGRLVLSFALALTESLEPGTSMAILVYDPEFFIAFTPDEGRNVSTRPSCSTTWEPPGSSADAARSLPESFFQNLTQADDWGRRYAGRTIVTCQPGATSR